jgi:uncharacterized damage-inducible protein DinB
MDHQAIEAQLGVNVGVFKHLFQNLSEEQARWKPGADRWSMLEVICHLYDEEREDFRKRLKLTLNDPEAPWPPIDPEGWVLERSYHKKDLEQSLRNFFKEREKSLQWLDHLQSPAWKSTHRHPQMGLMSAELILANWLAHDFFHIRQASELHFTYLTKAVSPISLSYSGWD